MTRITRQSSSIKSSLVLVVEDNLVEVSSKWDLIYFASMATVILLHGQSTHSGLGENVKFPDKSWLKPYLLERTLLLQILMTSMYSFWAILIGLQAELNQITTMLLRMPGLKVQRCNNPDMTSHAAFLQEFFMPLTVPHDHIIKTKLRASMLRVLSMVKRLDGK